MQITAPISHGSSGGPVVSDRGEVVAIAVATVSGGQNLNFAVPAPKLTAFLARYDAERRDAVGPVSVLDRAWKASAAVARALASAPRPDPYAGSGPNPTFEAVDVILLPPDLGTVIKEAKNHAGERLSVPGLRLVRAFAEGSMGMIRLSVEEIATGVRQNGYGEFYFQIGPGNDLTAMREGVKKYKDAELRVDFEIVRSHTGPATYGRVLGMYWLDRAGRVAHSATFPR